MQRGAEGAGFWPRSPRDQRPRPRRGRFGAALGLALLVGGLWGLVTVQPPPRPVGEAATAAAASSRTAHTREPLRAHVGLAALAESAAPGAPPEAPAHRPAPPRRPPRSFTLAVSGDVLPHLQVVAQAAALGRADSAPYDFAPLLAPIAGIVGAADLALCHLEVPLATDGTRPSGYPVFRSPAEVATGLAATGYDGCSTASNHSVDAGMPGLTQTLDALDAAGLRHAGTARTPPESQTPVIYDVRGVRVGHLAATYGLNGLPVPRDAPWSVNLLDPAAILGGSRGLRAAGAEVVVVSLHWGVEYRAAPTAEQEAIAEQLLASGEIDAIVGHHAHVVQPVARLHDRVVVYGLGNLLSGQSQPERRDGVVVTLRFAEEDAARHPTPGRFRVREVVATPTLVTRPDYRVAAIPELLADPALDAVTRAQLEASRARTAATLGPEAVTR